MIVAVGALFGATTAVALGAALWSTMMFVGAVVGAALFMATGNQQQQGTQSATYGFDRISTQTSNRAPIPIIYGHVKVGGNKIWQKVSDDGNTVDMIVGLGWGEIWWVHNIRINDLALVERDIFTIRHKTNAAAKVKVTDDRFYISPDGVNESYFEFGDYSVKDLTDWIKRQSSDWEITNQSTDAMKATDIIPTEKTVSTGILKTVTETETTETATTTVSNGWASCGPSSPYSPREPGLGEGTYVNIYTGTGTQTIDSMVPDGINTIGSMKHIAYLAVHLVKNDRISGGSVNVTCEVYGLKVPVYRDGVWTKEYSNTPAWCILDLMRNDLYGLNFSDSEIDIDTFIASAPFYDETIASGVARFTLNYCLDSKKSAIEYLDELRIGCRSLIFQDQGKFMLIPEKAETPVEYFETKDFVKDSFKVTHADSSTMYDTVWVNFVDKDSSWAKSYAESNQDGVLAEDADSKKISKGEYTLNMITSSNEALRLAHFFRVYNSLCPYTIEFKTKRKGITRTVGDVIGVSDHVMEWNQQAFRIIGKTADSKGVLTFIAKIHYSQLYTDDLIGEVNVAMTSSLPNPYGKIPDVPYISLTEGGSTANGVYVPYLDVSWGAVEYKFLDYFLVSARVNSGEWQDIITTRDSTYRINNCLKGDSYEVKIRLVSSFNRLSTGIVTAAYEIKGIQRMTAPELHDITVSSIHREIGNGQIVYELPVKWGINNKSVFSHVDMLMRSSVATWEEVDDAWDDLDDSVTYENMGITASGWKYVGRCSDSFTFYGAVSGATYEFKLVVVNTAGESTSIADSDTVTYTVEAKTYTPEVPTGFTITISDVAYASWSANSANLDIDFYELRTDKNPGSATNRLYKNIATESEIKLYSRVGTIYLYAHNSSGNYSEPASYYYKIVKPSAPTVTVTDIFQGLIISVDSFPSGVYSMNVKLDNGSNIQTYNSTNTSFTYSNTAGIFDIYVSYCDYFGEGTYSTAIHKIVSPEIDPALIKAESLSLEKMDANVKAAVANMASAVTGTTFNSYKNEMTQVADGLAAQIVQTAGQITSVVTELGKDASECSFTAVVQTQEAIQLRAEKGELVSLINLSTESITIDGKFIHVTGQTLFDDNVIVEGMIAANAIKATNIDAGAIEADHISLNSISLEKLLKEAWTPCWRSYVSPVSSSSNVMSLPWEFDTTWKTSIPSLGAVRFTLGDTNHDVHGVLFEMNVYCTAGAAAAQKCYISDDNVYIYLNGTLIYNAASGFHDDGVYYYFATGNNLIQIVLNNAGGGPVGLTLEGDIINGTTIKYNG